MTPAFAAALGLALTAQQTPVFPSSVDLVHIAVSVNGPLGEHIRDLKAADFTVRQDGRKKPIETFLRVADGDPSPVDVLLLLDISTSMTPDLLRASDAIEAFVATLPAARPRAILSFEHAIRVWRLDDRRIAPVLDEVLRTNGGAGTRLFDAIVEGSRRLSTYDAQRRALVVLTDGEDSGSRQSMKDAVAALQESGIVLYAVSYSSHMASFGNKPSDGRARVRESETTLRKLAASSGGLVVDGASRDLGAEFGKIREDIASQYLIGIAASSEARHHTLKIEVARKPATVRHREGYGAKPSAR